MSVLLKMYPISNGDSQTVCLCCQKYFFDDTDNSSFVMIIFDDGNNWFRYDHI